MEKLKSGMTFHSFSNKSKGTLSGSEEAGPQQKEVLCHITCDLSMEFVARVLNGRQKYKLTKNS